MGQPADHEEEIITEEVVNDEKIDDDSKLKVVYLSSMKKEESSRIRGLSRSACYCIVG